jgi:hypothetical protein
VKSLPKKHTLSTLAQLETEINSGKTAWVSYINHGSAQFSLSGPGQYAYHLETIAGNRHVMSEEDDHDTLETFIAGIEWDYSDELSVEMRSYLSRPVWYIEPDGYMLDPHEFDDTGVYQGQYYPIRFESGEDMPF